LEILTPQINCVIMIWRPKTATKPVAFDGLRSVAVKDLVLWVG